jgi:hypothetical protein
MLISFFFITFPLFQLEGVLFWTETIRLIYSSEYAISFNLFLLENLESNVENLH